MKEIKKYLAEFIGTAVLVLFACGVAGQICATGVSGLIGTALAFGLVIVAMAYSIGNVSGCHTGFFLRVSTETPPLTSRISHRK